MKTLSVATGTHGRVLLRESPGAPLAVLGFHGYTENAEIQMERLAGIPGADQWLLVSVQGLHRFYRGRSEVVVASWMTRQDREFMIADNVAYIDRVVELTVPAGLPIVTIGFSQGVAMAFRAAVRGARPAAGVIGVGGDVPPELLADPEARFPAALLTRGARDDWYTTTKLESDAAALRNRGILVETLAYDGGHEWTPEVASEASVFIRHLTG